ncbi:MAG: hypothetical protein WDZ54_03715 [Sneathiella sp.]
MSNNTKCRLPKRRPTYTLDELKNSVVHVPLSDGSYAIVNASDFQRLINSGVTDQWTISSNGDNAVYVRCRHMGKMYTVARLITGTPANTNIRYKNGDHRDLRKSNLKLTMKKVSLYAV